MFDETSRYNGLDITTTEITDSDGTVRQVRYVQRRFIPPTDDTLTVVEHIVTAGDRLDNIAARYLGDPLLFWQICDANNILRPEELEQPGTSVKITLPNL
jgi:nucleoid-associated protein YgaU